jgi:hypothetical protein
MANVRVVPLPTMDFTINIAAYHDWLRNGEPDRSKLTIRDMTERVIASFTRKGFRLEEDAAGSVARLWRM